MNTKYRKNLKDVATACKNYTNQEIAKSEERMKWYIGEYTTTTSDDNTSASTKTVPSNATRCKIKRIYGLTQKLNPTFASDDTTALVKTMPSVVYDLDVNKIYGASEKYNNLITDTQPIIVDSPTNNSGYDIRNLLTNGKTYYIKGNETQTNPESDQNYRALVIKGYNTTNSTYENIVVLGTSGNENVSFDTSFVADLTTYSSIKITLSTNSTGHTITLSDLSLGTEPYYSGIHNLELSGLVVKNSDDEVMQTLPIDLTTIEDSGGNKLFADGSLKGVGNVADEITPYKAIKRIAVVDLGTLSWEYDSDSKRFTSPSLTNLLYPSVQVATDVGLVLSSMYNTISGQSQLNDLTLDMTISQGSGDYPIVRVRNLTYTDATTFKNAMNGVYIYCAMNTSRRITVDIDWSSRLRSLIGYSNGTITLQNTYNMDTANLITYNSILKENCCAKIVQTRGGSVVKTINLPTVASDGYSAGSVYNVRDLTTSKRIWNVDKIADLGDITPIYTNNIFLLNLGSYDYKQVSSGVNGDYLVNNYTENNTETYVNLNDFETTNRTAGLDSTIKGIIFKDSRYSSYEEFNTAITGESLYFENSKTDEQKTSDITAVDNIIEVQAGDELAFYDSNDNLITVPSDLTYRIEVAN